MSLLFKVVFASAARGTHHKLALDALRHLRGPDAQQWMDVFLRYNRSYLEGAKAPDTEFKDFRNHVLHVNDGYWGGAVAATEKWYAAALKAFRGHDWGEGVYSLGVLSHYFSDALMPLHTGQSEDEGPVHRAVEWSVCKSYGELQNILDQDQGGYPRWECPPGNDWLAQMVRRAAEIANPHYGTVIDHYNLALGVRNPPLGLDQTLKDCLASCLGHAVVGLARIIERLIQEAKSVPPFVDVTLQGVVAAAKLPFRVLASQIENVREREALRLIYDEFERTGKVVQNLSDDDAQVRELHAKEVLKTTLTKLNTQPIRPPGQAHGDGAARRARSRRSVTTLRLNDGREASSAAERATKRPRAVTPITAETSLERSMSIQEILTIATAKPPLSEASLPRLKPVVLPTAVATAPAPIAAPPPSHQAPAATSSAVTRSASPPPNQSPIPPREAVPVMVSENPPAEARREAKLSAIAETPPSTDIPKASGPAASVKKKETAKAKPASEPASPVLKFHLDRSQPIQNAPSIGNKTAEKMRAAGVTTVGELLASHPEKLAAKLNVPHIIPDVIRQWQAEATLVCRVPGLRGHDAQILVACGIDQPAELAECEPQELLELVLPFVESSDGQRVLRGGTPPDLEEVTEWIGASQQARSLKAA